MRVKSDAHFLRIFAGCTLALGVCRLLFIDNFNTQTLVFNARFATFLVAIAIMAGIVAAGERYGSEREMPFVKLAGVALNLLALMALTGEANDYFNRQITETYQHRGITCMRPPATGDCARLQLLRHMDCLRRGAHGHWLLEAVSVHPLAGHGAAGCHHWQSFSL